MILSILIPTYNRCDIVVNLLNYVQEELSKIDSQEEVEVIVSDNCSTDNTVEQLEILKSEWTLNTPLVVNKNKSNINIVGNILALINLAHGEYVWIMGDDDIYYEGLIGKLIPELKLKLYSYVFINHCNYVNYRGDGTGKDSMIDGVNLNVEDGKKVILDIYERSGNVLMFTSASVHRLKNVQECIKKYKVNFALALVLSFYSGSRGRVKVIESVEIEDVIKGISWHDKFLDVFAKYVPYYIWILPKLGYDRMRSRRILFNYVIKWRRAFFACYIKRPLRKLLEKK